VDVLIAGVGTGGTFTGAGRYLREMNAKIDLIAVEPVESPVISGGKPGPHKIQGIGAGFVPKNFDRSILSAVELVSSEESISMAKRVIREEGVPVGISSGGAIAAALKLAANPAYAGKTFVVILASSTERYLSTLLGEEARTKAASLTVAPVSDEMIARVQF
jgi:cysteine synthase A